MTKNELQEKIEELKKSIEESEENISDMESRIEDLETELEWERGDLEDKESQLEHYTKQLLILQTPQEQLSYWVEFIHDECRPKIDGQFENNGKWYVCNGYVLLEVNKKLDCLPECEGMESLPRMFDKDKFDKTEIKIDTNILSNSELLGNNINITPSLCISGTYFLAIKNILQLDKKSKFYSVKGCSQSNKSREFLMCENQNGQALILGIENFD